MIRVSLFLIIAIIFLFIPGYALFSYFNIFKQNIEKIAFAPFVAIILGCALELLRYSHFINIIILISVSVLILLISAGAIFIKRKDIIFIREDYSVLAILISFFLITTAYIGMPLKSNRVFFPDPEYNNAANYETLNVKVLNLAHTAANDNYVPFRQAQFFNNSVDLNDSPYLMPEWGVNFFYRTPVMGLFSAYYFDLFNQKLSLNYPWQETGSILVEPYIQFQLLAQFLNSIIILSAFVFVKKMFDKRVAFATVSIMAISGFFVYNSFFTWPKSFVAYAILAAFYLIISKKNYFFSGIILAIAYLIHDLALFYIVGAVLTIIVTEKTRLKLLFKLLTPFIILILPWYIIGRVIFKQESLFIYYPFAVKGLPIDKGVVIKEFLSTPIITIILAKLDSLLFLITPYQVIFERGHILDRLAIATVFSLPGAVGLSIVPFTLIGLYKNFSKDWVYIVSIIFIPILFAIFFIGWPKGLGALHFAQASVVLLIACGLSSLKRYSKRAKVFTLILLVAQLGVVLLYGHDYNILSWTSSSKYIILSLLMLLTLIVPVYGYLVSMGVYKNNKLLINNDN